MTRNTGIDPMRGRPTPGIASTEEKIQRRKLDSLRRGIHRIDDAHPLPYRVHLVGIGSAGAAVVARAIEPLSNERLDQDGARLSVLAIDIGDSEGLKAVRKQQQRISSCNAYIEVMQLDVPSASELQETLDQYEGFLRLEYPLYEGTTYRPWLDASAMSASGDHFSRALSKAIYGRAYYDGARPAHAALKRFADSVTATPDESIVCLCFGLGGGTGSGVVVDLARHLSNVRFGRRVLVAGIGIGPCDGDRPEHKGASLYPVLNELDCIADESKNQGVVMACGDLYRNPFTAGFLMVPQQPVWDATRNLRSTHCRVDDELAWLLTARNGANLWELLRLLNWVAAPSTQHSAARTPYGSRWIHMWGFADVEGTTLPVDSALRGRLGLRSTYEPQFIEARIGADADGKGRKAASKLYDVFGPIIEPEMVGQGRAGSVQFILPQIAKTDLSLFAAARAAYETQPRVLKVLDHSWLLERGLLLCERSTKLEGMAGASLHGENNWVAVPYAALRGEEQEERQTAAETM